MKRSVMMGVLVLALAAGSVFAQGDAVLLRYKFTAGQQFKSIETVRGTLPVQAHVKMPEGAAEGGGDVAVQVVLDTSTVKLMSVREVDADGVATCAVKIDYMVADTKTTQGEQEMLHRVEFKDGKLTSTGGGPQDQMTPEKQEQLEKLLNTEFILKMDPLGSTEPIGTDFEKVYSELMGSSLGGMDMRKLSRLTTGLPEKPVAVGESWEVVLPAEEGAGAEGRLNATLAEIVDEGGHRVARINSTSYIKMENLGADNPENQAEGQPAQEGQQQPQEGEPSLTAGMLMKIPSMDMTMAFQTAFDIDEGRALRVNGEMTLNMDQEMTIDLGAMLGGEAGGAKIELTNQIRDAKLTLDTTTELLAQ